MAPDKLFQPLAKTRLHEEIVDRLKTRILLGELAPGTKLPSERELSEQLGVNRTTLREALHKLESLDLVELQHGRGIFVKDYRDSRSLELAEHLLHRGGGLDLDVLRNLADLRRILLPEMAAEAARHRSAADLEAFERLVRDDAIPVEEKDWRVHNLVARASGNVLFAILLNAFTSIAREASRLYFASETNCERSRRFHAELLAALAAKDDLAARRIMHDVLVYAEKAAFGGAQVAESTTVSRASGETPRRSPRTKERSK